MFVSCFFVVHSVQFQQVGSLITFDSMATRVVLPPLIKNTVRLKQSFG